MNVDPVGQSGTTICGVNHIGGPPLKEMAAAHSPERYSRPSKPGR